MGHRTCQHCGANITGRSDRKWCSDRCRNRSRSSIASTDTWTCIGCGTKCERVPVRGQRPKWCDNCRASGKRERTCLTCGTVGLRSDQDYCSVACKPDYRKRRGKPTQPSLPLVFDLRSPIRRAYEDGNTADVVAAVRRDVQVVPDTGCWEWQRQINREGYAEVTVGRSRKLVHRLVMGDPGPPVVHHACANRRCVNPEHLQLVTQRENGAEMLERNYYLRRIADLEAALESFAPNHHLLTQGEVPLGASHSNRPA